MCYDLLMVSSIEIWLMVFLFIVGAAMGSFACCQVWRIKKSDKSKWSHCMHCGYRLRWYDNVPILSWLFLKGKCRKCHKKIGATEIWSELGSSVFFVVSFWLWPFKTELLAGNGFEIAKFVVFLLLMTVFVILFIYDLRWKQMPMNVMWWGIGLGLVYLAINYVGLAIAGDFSLQTLIGLAGALLMLPIFYYLMYKVSREALVGSGDWILCLPLALVLSDFWLGMFALFAANILGSIVSLPILIVKKDRHMKIPFGPFLIMGFWIVFMAQSYILALVRI